MATIEDLDKMLKQRARQKLRKQIKGDISAIFRWGDTVNVTVTTGTYTVSMLASMIEQALFEFHEARVVQNELDEFMGIVHDAKLDAELKGEA